MTEEVAGARVRALLHHQGGRQGHRPRPVDGLWHGAPVGRHGADRQHARRRHHGQALFPPGRPTPSPRGGRGADEPRRHRGTRADASVLVIDDDPDVRGFIVDQPGGTGLSRARGERRPQGPGGDRARDARPRHPRLHHARPVGRRGRHRILARQPGQPILFVSGYSETEAVKRVAPDAPLLAKPFRADALDKRCASALAKG